MSTNYDPNLEQTSAMKIATHSRRRGAVRLSLSPLTIARGAAKNRNSLHGVKSSHARRRTMHFVEADGWNTKAALVSFSFADVGSVYMV